MPLWAHHPSPKEMLALPELWCGQIIFSAMLFPLLARSSWALVINLMLTIPFAELAGLLSNTPQTAIFKGEFCVALWITGLGLWGMHRIERPIAAIAVLFSAGTAMLDYLRWESLLSEGSNAAYHPLSLLPNLVQENWTACWLQATVPLFLLLIALPFLKPSTNSHFPHRREISLFFRKFDPIRGQFKKIFRLRQLIHKSCTDLCTPESFNSAQKWRCGRLFGRASKKLYDFHSHFDLLLQCGKKWVNSPHQLWMWAR